MKTCIVSNNSWKHRISEIHLKEPKAPHLDQKYCHHSAENKVNVKLNVNTTLLSTFISIALKSKVISRASWSFAQ